MRRVRNLIAICLLAVCSATVMAQVPRFIDTNPGIVESSSIKEAQLPTRAAFFLDNYYKGYNILSMVEEYIPHVYQVTIDNGTFMEFDAEGNLIKIDAPQNKCLPEMVLKGEMSKAAYNEMKTLRLQHDVSSLTVTPRGPQLTLLDKTLDNLRQSGL